MLTRLSSTERWTDALRGIDSRSWWPAYAPTGHRVVGNVRFVNAGSVGLPYEGDGAARWVWVADRCPRAAPDRLRRRPRRRTHPRGRLAGRAIGPGGARRARRGGHRDPDLRGSRRRVASPRRPHFPCCGRPISSPARGRVVEDGADDGVPVGSIDAVTGSLQRQQGRPGYLLRQGLAVLEWEHRVRGAVNHERGRGDRRQRLARRLVARDGVVVLRRGEVARALSRRAISRTAVSSKARWPPASMRW